MADGTTLGNLDLRLVVLRLYT
ncbi:hypothetical protein CCACVL1_06537 [Corchorus capsularis]|uniref:Uncharacterized protein n=1 Tax=Corchorus capsularis TaxID=210143 RepID=A0A1R3JER7_COCAP|nr:hypothetical protein CCACVL1_06537 [Corchorus capsularis]